MDVISTVVEQLPSYGEPLAVTVGVTVGGALLALVIAFGLGLAAGSHLAIVRGAARVVIEFFRGTSLVVQLYWIAIVVPLVFQFRFEIPMLIGVLALGMNYGAYAAEVVRGSIASVAKGQYEACVALNFTYWQRMRLVVVPQAWPEMIPPLSTLAILLLKGSSLVSLVSITDLTLHAKTLGGRPNQEMLIHLGMILVIYFVLSWFIASGMRLLERRAKAGIGQEPPKRSALAEPAASALGG